MKNLIVKTGALGDVLRTTVLLNELEGEIYWITKRNAKDLLNSNKITKVIFIEEKEEIEKIRDISFDLVLSLEEDKELLKLLKEIKIKKLVGLFLDESGNFDYTPESNEWFDMSLASKYGKERADSLKKDNRKSHNRIFIEMIGKKFNGQEYDLGVKPKKESKKIGIINRSGDVWPNKQWWGYNKLRDRLKEEGFEVYDVPLRHTLKEHIDDINNCGLIICGDTLGMHIALALKKKVVALFNCTSPHEIYSYNRMIKVVSPLYEKFFYLKTLNEEVINSIKFEDVYSAVKKAID